MTARIDKNVVAVILLSLIILVFFSPVLFEGKTFFSRDLTVLHYPLKHLIYQAYHHGEIPFWNPSVYNGTPFLPVMYTGVLYPLNLIFFLNDFATAFNWFYILHYALLTFSVYALTRYWGLSAGAALCSAITALLSGFFLSLLTLGLMSSAAWLPSIFYWTQRYLQEKKIVFFLGAVFCLACQILGGGGVEFCLLTVLTLFFWLLTQTSETAWTKKTMRCATVLGSIIVTAWGITAPQLFSTFSMLGESTRSNGMAFDVHAMWSMRPFDLTTLLVPKNFRGFMEAEHSEPFYLFQSFYMGLFAVVFLCNGFLYLRQKEIRFWIMVFLLGIFLALGEHNPFYQFFFKSIPMLGLFRYPEKFYFLAAFSQVFLVGYGVDALIRAEPVSHLKTSLFILIGIAVTMAGVALVAPERVVSPSFSYLAIFGAICLMFFSRKWGAVRFKSILFMLIFLDLILNNHMLVPMIDKTFYETMPGAAAEVNNDKELSRLYVGQLEGTPDKLIIPGSPLMQYIALKEMLAPDLGALYGMQYADGGRGLGLETRNQFLWMEIFHASPPEKRLRMLKRSNVKYWIAPMRVYEDWEKVQLLDNSLPRAFMVPSARQGKDPQLLNTYYDESFDPLKEILLNVPVTTDEKLHAAEFVGSVESIHYGLNRVVVQTRQNGVGFLVLLDSWFPGWSVTVDDTPDHIFQANHFYRAVRLAPGDHVVRFTYMPVGFKLGMLVFEITIVILVGWCVLQALMQRRISTDSNNRQ